MKNNMFMLDEFMDEVFTHLADNRQQFAVYVPTRIELEEKYYNNALKMIESADWEESVPEVVSVIMILMERKNAILNTFKSEANKLDYNIGSLLNRIEWKTENKNLYRKWRKAIFKNMDPKLLNQVQKNSKEDEILRDL